MKISVTFAGQGSQYTGMGKDLYEHYTAARAVFDLAGDQIKDWCFTGDEETLKQTNVTQPCVYTVTMAAYQALLQALCDRGLTDKAEISTLAGFSLGEYSALTAAGTIDSITKGIDIVTKRGLLMQEAGLDVNGAPRGGMVAVRSDGKTAADIVEAVRENDILEVANYNSPSQTVVAGDKTALKRFQQEAKKHNIKTTPLPVSVASHNPMMEPAAEKLRKILQAADLQVPKYTVYSNVTADDIMKNYNGGGNVSAYLADMMARQVMRPVRWENTVRRFQADGAQAIIEVGPGHTLTKLVKNICPEIPAFNIDDSETIEYTVGRLADMLKM